MAIVAEVTSSSVEGAPNSTPRRILRSVPEMEIEVESFVPISDTAIPYFWALGEKVTTFEQVLEDDPAVRNITRIERIDDGAFYSVEWDIDSPLIACLGRTNGAIMEAYGTVDEWELTIWFEQRTDASVCQQCCIDHDVPLEVDRLYSVAEARSGDTHSITHAQFEILRLAYERGYFEQPREISQNELAEELDVSASAISSRLRRGINNLIEDAIVR